MARVRITVSIIARGMDSYRLSQRKSKFRIRNTDRYYF